VTLTFDLIFLAWLAAAMDYICTNISIGDSSCFPFTARTPSIWNVFYLQEKSAYFNKGPNLILRIKIQEFFRTLQDLIYQTISTYAVVSHHYSVQWLGLR